MSKNLYLFVFVVVAAMICLAATAANSEYVCGDANDDGTLNVSDAVFIITHVFIGGPAPDPWESGEVNCDGALNISDAVRLINYVFKAGYAPCDTDGDGIPDCGFYCPPTVTDYDGNVYHTVLIGDQCWMMDNLKVTHYSNGDPIPNVTDSAEWEGLTTGAYCNYNNDEGNVAIYGRLYNWYAVDDSRNIAPVGWHVPSDAELKQLEMYLGMSRAEADATGLRGTDEGGKLKEAGTTHWYAPDTGGTNESGFSALPGGCRYIGGTFGDMGNFAYFWSSPESSSNRAWLRLLYYGSSYVFRFSGDKRYGFSVRCVRD
ncbi:MAG TPA: hypothetical protein ENO22_02605 [candidate division Zixibacteria bacterium]|nr:hypothetical protein [candidate division Zixibacteria bacterium]